MMLEKLEKLGISLTVKDNGANLLVSPKCNITPKIRELIKANKQALIEEVSGRVVEPVRLDFTPPVVLPGSDRSIVTFVIGEAARRIAKYTLPSIREYAEKCGADLIVVRDDQVPSWPIGNKLRFGEYAAAYDSSLLVDCDVFINRHAPDIFSAHGPGVWMHSDVNFVNQFGYDYLMKELLFVAEAHGKEVVLRRSEFGRQSQRWYTPPEFAPPFFNTGVILIDKPSAKRWMLPTAPLETSHTAEQAWIDLMLSNQFFINRLDPTWNWLAFGKNFKQKIESVNFVHLANCSHAERLRLLRRKLTKPNKEKSNAICTT